jgi:polysaccharide biosynthesis protein PslJ
VTTVDSPAPAAFEGTQQRRPTDPFEGTQERRRGDPTTLPIVYLAVLFLIPSRYTLGSFAITASMVVGLVGLVLWTAGKVTPGTGVEPGLATVPRTVLAFLAVMVVSYALSHATPLTTDQLKGADRALAAILSLAGIALIVADTMHTRAQLYRLFAVLVSVAGIAAAIGILQYVAGIDVSASLRLPGFKPSATGFIFTRLGERRAAGTAMHPIEFGAMCAVTIPLAIHVARFHSNAIARTVAWVSAVLLIVATPMALSRSSLVVLGVEALVLLPAWPAPQRWRIIVGAIIVLLGLNWLTPAVLSASNRLVTTNVASGSNTYRSEANHLALVQAGHHPILGQGFGTFDQTLSSHTNVILDNSYMVMLVEVGAVGTAALVGLHLVPIAAAWRSRRRSQDPDRRDLLLTLAAMILGIGVVGWALNVLSYPLIAGLLFFTIGAVGAAIRLAPRAVRQEP